MAIKVLMMGESLNRQGGIVSVEKLILDNRRPDISYKHIPTLPKGSAIYKLFVFLNAIISLIGNSLAGDIDVVHIHVSERGSAYRKAVLASLAAALGKPTIMHTHGSEFHIFFENLPPFLKHLILKGFQKCDRLIALSESWKNFYVKHLELLPEQVVVLPNPVNIPIEIPDRSKIEQVRFVSLGRIGQRKGSFDLIQAFAAIPRELQAKSELILAGDGEGDNARRMVKKLNLADKITVLDWVDAQQRDALLAEASVFTLPSYNEGLPMAILEAMSWGLPVLTTPVGGIPELVSHNQNGFLVHPGDVGQLSKHMQTLIVDRDARLRLGHTARQDILPFSVEAYCQALQRIYHSAILSKSHS